jgi:ubiquinone/menaquinone biosynthesis C-methylase UbiE
MTQVVSFGAQGASAAFDRMAGSYDAIFTESTIGRAQRKVIWDALKRTFRAGDRVLELNCGTGEDALFLARREISALACDASAGMIAVAERRKSLEAPGASLQFRVLPNENLSLLQSSRFDGALSNFSGLNCVADPRQVALQLARLVKSGGPVLICISTRVCLWEIVWYLVQLKFSKAFRRVRGRTIAQLDQVCVPVWYPTIRRMRQLFSPGFRLCSVRAVGLFVPPSYVESWAREHQGLLAALEKMDQIFAGWPLLRSVGDHVLLEFERTQQ